MKECSQVSNFSWHFVQTSAIKTVIIKEAGSRERETERHTEKEREKENGKVGKELVRLNRTNHITR